MVISRIKKVYANLIRGLQKNNINNHGQYKEKQKCIFWDQPLKLHEYDFQENL